AGSALLAALCLGATPAANADPILGFNISNIDVTNQSGSTYNTSTNLIEVVEYQATTSGLVLGQITADATSGGGNPLIALQTNTANGAGFFISNYPPLNPAGLNPFFNTVVPAQGQTDPDGSGASFLSQGTGNASAGTGGIANGTIGASGLDTNNTFGYAFYLVTDPTGGSGATTAQFLGGDQSVQYSDAATNFINQSFVVSAGNIIDVSFDVNPIGLPEPPASLTLGLLLGAAFMLRKTTMA
ncbi:MAG TPA: hypothetical protein VGO93_24100, partial [Candidatus Xenobia bacterium]